MLVGKNGNITVSMKLSPRANQALRQMVGRPRAMGRFISELIMEEQVRRQERQESAKAQGRGAGE